VATQDVRALKKLILATIALDATYTVDPEPSGIAVYSRRLIESLADLETSHRFLLCYRLSRWRRRREFLRPSTAWGPRGQRFSTRLYQEPFTFWLARQAEIFHSLAQRPPAFRFRQEVVTVFDVFPITGENYSAPEFSRKFAALLRQAVLRAARVITLSRYTAGKLREHCSVPRDRIRVIPAGVDAPAAMLTAEERQRAREELVGAGHEMLLSVGVIQTRKNTLNALRALTLLPERYKLVLAGGGKGYGNEAVYCFIREAGLERRVHLLGYVPPARLVGLYDMATVFVFPSLEEGFGIPVLEAMAHGLPVVTSSSSSLPEVGGEAALYVDPTDPADIARKVAVAAEDNRVRQRMIQQGLARVREFTWRRAAEETCRVYDELLG
jgi:glycosyltransferase involved in cell wall biosynthesis